MTTFHLRLSFLAFVFPFLLNASPLPLPLGCGQWLETAVGSVSGSATYESCGGGTVSITTNASGSTLSADKQYGVYTQVCGDGEFIVHVTGLSPTSGKAGIELRESDDEGSKKFGVYTSLGTSFFRIYRTTDDGNATQSITTSPATSWFKLVRQGIVLEWYSSGDGQSWSYKGTVTIPMEDCIEAGVFVQSPNVNTQVTASFDDIAISGFSDPEAPITEVSFSQDTISAYPGDTIQVCVDLVNPCPCSLTSVEIGLDGVDWPHLTGYSTAELVFTGSESQKCFNLVIGTDSIGAVYSLDLENVSGGNGATAVNPNELILVVNGPPPPPVFFCGVFPPSDLDSSDITIGYDRFGNGYSYQILKI